MLTRTLATLIALALAALMLLASACDGEKQETPPEPTPTPTAAPPRAGKIAFTSDRDDTLDIYVMNADGSDQINLTNNPATDLSPAWSLAP